MLRLVLGRGGAVGINESRHSDARVVLLGPNVGSGAYVLRVAVRRGISVVFGRYRGGAPVPVAAGSYVYVGSAMGAAGRHPLARRLLRHATRCVLRPPHGILPDIAKAFAPGGTTPALAPPKTKTIHWHIDYLLDRTEAEITHVAALRSPTRLEAAVSKLLEAHPAALPLAPGLGAGDAPGRTHLLRVDEDPGWWRTLIGELSALADRAEP